MRQEGGFGRPSASTRLHTELCWLWWRISMRPEQGKCERRLTLGRVALSLLFVGAGLMHFVLPKAFVSIVPDYLPSPRTLVVLSGAVEVAGGLGLFFPRVRRPAAWVLVALLMAVFPANLWMAQNPERFRPLAAWQLWARLPLQVPLIAWAWLYTRPERSWVETN